jgi:hypothetical protein
MTPWGYIQQNQDWKILQKKWPSFSTNELQGEKKKKRLSVGHQIKRDNALYSYIWILFWTTIKEVRRWASLNITIDLMLRKYYFGMIIVLLWLCKRFLIFLDYTEIVIEEMIMSEICFKIMAKELENRWRKIAFGCLSAKAGSTLILYIVIIHSMVLAIIECIQNN